MWSQFRRWSRNGTWATVLAALHEQGRAAVGRDRLPSMLVIDSSLARGASQGGVTFHDRGGPYGATNGAKRVVAVDVTGLPVRAIVVPASTTESRATELLLEHLTELGLTDRLELVLVDRGTTAKAARARRAAYENESRNMSTTARRVFAALLVPAALAGLTACGSSSPTFNGVAIDKPDQVLSASLSNLKKAAGQHYIISQNAGCFYAPVSKDKSDVADVTCGPVLATDDRTMTMQWVRGKPTQNGSATADKVSLNGAFTGGGISSDEVTTSVPRDIVGGGKPADHFVLPTGVLLPVDESKVAGKMHNVHYDGRVVGVVDHWAITAIGTTSEIRTGVSKVVAPSGSLRLVQLTGGGSGTDSTSSDRSTLSVGSTTIPVTTDGLFAYVGSEPGTLRVTSFDRTFTVNLANGQRTGNEPALLLAPRADATWSKDYVGPAPDYCTSMTVGDDSRRRYQISGTARLYAHDDSKSFAPDGKAWLSVTVGAQDQGSGLFTPSGYTVLPLLTSMQVSVNGTTYKPDTINRDKSQLLFVVPDSTTAADVSLTVNDSYTYGWFDLAGHLNETWAKNDAVSASVSFPAANS